MKRNDILKRLEGIYHKLNVKFSYPQVPWKNIFNIPDSGRLVEEFIKRATSTDIEVKTFDNTKDLIKQIDSIFSTYKKVWVDNILKQSPLFKDKPIVFNQWEAEAGITTCKALLVRTGSIIIDSAVGRQAGLIAPHHFVLANACQIYPDLFDYFEKINNELTMPSSISIVSGPSRTADIEKKLVKGAHGPAQVTVLLLVD